MTLEPFVTAGLYDPDDPKAHERRELLEHLLARGYSTDDIIEAVSIAGPVTDVAWMLAFPNDRDVVPFEEMAARCGATSEELEELRNVLGLTRVGTTTDSVPATFEEDFALFRLGAAAYGTERVLAFGRVVGAAIAAMMEAGRELVLEPLQGNEPTELELSQANEFATAAWQQVISLVGHTMWEHRERDKEFQAELIRGDVTMAVSFVDLIGSTEWTARLSAREHRDAIARFEDVAARLAAQQGCRVVKFLGDGAMIVGGNVEGVATAAARLCGAAHEDADLPDARGAVAWGAVQPRGGDYYGEVVNLAARATKHAPVSGIVITQPVLEKLDPSRWSIGEAVPQMLRGIEGDVELFEAAPLG